jgi:hypothetical protein
MSSMKLRPHMLALIMLALGATGIFAAAPAGPQQTEEELYHAVEPNIRSAYEEAVKSGTILKIYNQHLAAFKKAQSQYATDVPGNWADHIDADDWLKMFYYNEASIGVSCAQAIQLDAANLAKDQGDLYTNQFLPCVTRGVQQMGAFFQLDNLLLTYSTEKFSTECEPKARLVNRERSLPPYEFLRPKDPSSLRLMQFGVYLKCIVDRMGIAPSSLGLDPTLLDSPG